MEEIPDYVLRNRQQWDRTADQWVQGGQDRWAGEPVWGVWALPESLLHLLPDDMDSMAAIELGCGTGYVSAWMARRGATVVGIDNSEEQLKTARRLAAEHNVPLELVHGNAEVLPYPDESFDFAISEYGVAIWADPTVWVPEVARVLKPGGRLVVLGHHPMVLLTSDFNTSEPAGHALLAPYFDMFRVDWKDGAESGSEFNMPVSQWFQLFTDSGFDVTGYDELRAPRNAQQEPFGLTPQWAHDFPSEQVWKVRKVCLPRRPF